MKLCRFMYRKPGFYLNVHNKPPRPEITQFGLIAVLLIYISMVITIHLKVKHLKSRDNLSSEKHFIYRYLLFSLKFRRKEGVVTPWGGEGAITISYFHVVAIICRIKIFSVATKFGFQ